MPPTPRRLHALAPLLLASALAGCSSTAPTAERPGSIMIDGDTSDWPEGVVATADTDYLYIRFKVAGQPITLQSAPETLSILLDADNNPATGAPIAELPAAASMGVDLEIQFSPMTDAGTPATGVSAIAIDATGATERLSHADLDFHFSPTFASDWYEARISRQPTGSGLLAPSILQGRSVRGVMGLYDAAGTISGASLPFTADLPPAASSPRLSDLRIPAAPRSAIRVVSWNIHRSAPASNPAPFTRVLRALNPDVVLLQEWDTDAATIQAWFDAAMPEHAPWNAVATTGLYGVALVTRHRVTAVTESTTSPAPASLLMPEVTTAQGQSVRFVAASIATPLGQVLAASTHLKCCGSAGSDEDRRRLEEATAINRAFAQLASRTAPAIRLIGGDMNLVGTRGPLDVLGANIDADDSDLMPALAPILGDHAYYTWSDDANQFSPGRLDWLLVGDAQARVHRAFVLDTERLTDASLAQAKLQRQDSRASDHMPVVVDLTRR